MCCPISIRGFPLVGAYSSTGRKEGHAWVLDGYKQDYREIVTTYRWYTYSTTNPGDLGDGLPVTPENPDPDTETTTETEHTIEEPDTEISTAGDGLESVDSLNWPPKFPRSYRPKYATNRTYTTTSTIWDGYYWHMNWGWTKDYFDDWYATLEKWEVEENTYNKKRKMLLITGYR